VTVAPVADPVAHLEVHLAHPEIAELAACVIVIATQWACPITRLPLDLRLGNGGCICHCKTTPRVVNQIAHTHRGISDFAEKR
jgi:hypothetical protein